MKNKKSARTHSGFVESAILELLANRCIVEREVVPHCVNPLTVMKGKKLRLRHANQFLLRLRLNTTTCVPSLKLLKKIVGFSPLILNRVTIM